MRIGFIGYGSIGERHASLLLRYTKHITVFSQRLDVPAAYGVVRDWKAFRANGPYDAIFVTNETAAHGATIRRCLVQPPRAFFIEKPFTVTAREAAALAKLLKQKKVSAWVGYCLQRHEPLLRARRMVESGVLGRIHSLRVSVGQDLRTWRARDYRKGYSAKASRGGGALLDLIHEINYPSWLLGEALTPVAAHVARVGRLKMDAETLTEITCTTPTGTIVQIHQDCLRVPARRTLEIAGDRGSWWWDSAAGTITFSTARRTNVMQIATLGGTMYERQLAVFMRALRAGALFSNLEEAVRDAGVIDAVRKMAS